MLLETHLISVINKVKINNNLKPLRTHKHRIKLSLPNNKIKNFLKNNNKRNKDNKSKLHLNNLVSKIKMMPKDKKRKRKRNLKNLNNLKQQPNNQQLSKHQLKLNQLKAFKLISKFLKYF